MSIRMKLKGTKKSKIPLKTLTGPHPNRMSKYNSKTRKIERIENGITYFVGGGQLS